WLLTAWGGILWLRRIGRARPATDSQEGLAMRLQRVLQLTALALAAALGARLNGASGSTNGLPDSMAALGDSITRAFNADPNHQFGDQPENSWSTGTSNTIQSHYFRILQGNSNISGKNSNYAVSGAQVT